MIQKINYLLILLSISGISYGQITERTITPKEVKVNTTYNKEFNFRHHENIEEYKMYVGQEFYIFPSNFKSYVYEGDKNRFSEMYYKTPKQKDVVVTKGRK